MEVFVIQLPETPTEPEEPDLSPEDLALGREMLVEVDPEMERSFVAFSIRETVCDFHECDVQADVVVIAVHSSVRKTKITAFCLHHSECMRVAIGLRKPGEIDADEVDRLYAEMQRESKR